MARIAGRAAGGEPRPRLRAAASGVRAARGGGVPAVRQAARRDAAAAVAVPRRCWPGPRRVGQVDVGRDALPAVGGRLVRRAARGRRRGRGRHRRQHRRVRAARGDRRATGGARADHRHRHDRDGRRAPRPVARRSRATAGWRASRSPSTRPPPCAGPATAPGRHPVPAAALTAQLRAWPAVRDALDGEGFDRVLPPEPVRVVPTAFAGSDAAAAPAAGRADRAAVRAAPLGVPRRRGDPRAAAARDRRRRGGRGLRRDLHHGPLPADPAGRTRVGRLPRELHDARVAGRVHVAGAAGGARRRRHLPQRRAPRQDRRHVGRAVRRPGRVRPRAGLVRARSTARTGGRSRRSASATRCSRTRSRRCRCCGGRAASRSGVGCWTCPTPRPTRGRCRNTCRSCSAAAASGARWRSPRATPTPPTCWATCRPSRARPPCCVRTARRRGGRWRCRT